MTPNAQQEEFRIKYNFLQYIQFKGYIDFYFFKVPVWRYLPDHFVSGAFKKWQCPIYLPFSTSHCYSSFISKEYAEEWLKKWNSEWTIDTWLKALEKDAKEYYGTKKINL